jgi:hypothetical protein
VQAFVGGFVTASRRRSHRPRNSPETILKPDFVNLRASPFVEHRQKEIDMRRMIQVGSKEEVELLLALFGSHVQPPKKKQR